MFSCAFHPWLVAGGNTLVQEILKREGIKMNNLRDGRSTAASIDVGLLVLRVVTGLVFFMHGWQKLVDNGLDGTQMGFEAMGAPMPAISSVIVTFVELIGGAMLIAGAFTRLVSILLVVDMICAMLITHIDFGFFVMNGGVELVLLLGGAALALVFTGAGRYSADELAGLPYAGELVSFGEPIRR